MWWGPGWGWSWGASLVLLGLTPCFPITLEALFKAVAARVPLLGQGCHLLGVGGWVLPVPVLLPGWGLALSTPVLLPDWGLRGLPAQIIFPSFLCNNLLNLLNCLYLTFTYLNSLTLSINSWHCCIVVVETVNASCDTHMSLCLLLLSRRLLMVFTLAFESSLSAFLIISCLFCFNCSL